MRNVHPSCSCCICNRALQIGLNTHMLYKIISPQGLGIENMDKSHISLQLMGDFIQVLICCGCMVKPARAKETNSPRREKRLHGKECRECICTMYKYLFS